MHRFSFTEPSEWATLETWSGDRFTFRKTRLFTNRLQITNEYERFASSQASRWFLPKTFDLWLREAWVDSLVKKFVNSAELQRSVERAQLQH
ncbi:MAG TPA: hypothetical protein V6D03_15445, partial [Candidatus Caenarcaniphilales bacterium]